MILQGSTFATWDPMVGDVMPMKGLSYVEGQLNLLPPRSLWYKFFTWFFNSKFC
jgi:hypothetical protein